MGYPHIGCTRAARAASGSSFEERRSSAIEWLADQGVGARVAPDAGRSRDPHAHANELLTVAAKAHGAAPDKPKAAANPWDVLQGEDDTGSESD